MWRVRQYLAHSLQQINSWAGAESGGLGSYLRLYYGDHSSIPPASPFPSCQAVPCELWNWRDPMKPLRTDFSNISGALSSAFTPLPSQPCCLNGAGHWDRIPMTKELAENVTRAEIEMCVDLLEEGRAEWSGKRKQTEMLWAGSEQDDEELGNSWWMAAKTCWAETGQIPCV